jgi:hypothetical protein
VLEAETRGLAFACQARSTAAMLRAMLRLDAGEAWVSPEIVKDFVMPLPVGQR